MFHNEKISVVAGGIVGCAVAARLTLGGLANDNFTPVPPPMMARLSRRTPSRLAVDGLADYASVMVDTQDCRTLVKVRCI